MSPIRSGQRVVVASGDDPLPLACGRELAPVEVAFETYGELSPTGDNAIFVCHALTADAHAAGGGTDDPGWWESLIGPGRALDTDRYFVVCANLLGSCLGTTGPTSENPATGRAYGIDFPPITIGDQVAVHRRLCAALGIRRLHAVVGPSLGAMQALEWFLAAPEEIERTVLIAGSSKLTVENRAFSAAGRQAILDDPDFEGGRYLENAGDGPVRGLAAARRFAHITYVSPDALERKQGDEPPTDWPPANAAEWLAPSRAIERYLDYQGDVFVRRFDALSYLYLTRPMDDFDPFADRAAAAARIARNPEAAHLLVSFDSDWRFGTPHGQRTAAALRELGARHVHHRELTAPWGHDSFLLDPPGLAELVAEFIDRAPAAQLTR